MDGSEGRLSRSLQFRLSVWLSVVIACLALGAGVFSFVSAYQEAIELQDDQLAQMAALVGLREQPPGGEEVDRGLDEDPEFNYVVQFLPDRAGMVRADRGRSGADGGFSGELDEGLQTVMLGPVSWRVFVKTLAPDLRVAVAQRTIIRDEIARDSAFRTVMPLLVLIPVLLVLVGDVTRKMFGPLKGAAAELNARSEQDLTAVEDEGLPSEVRPFVAAINRLLRRVAGAMSMRQRFVADAAHELRSPLTALSLQAEHLETAEMSPEARERVATLRRGIRRTRDLLEQLLTQVRVQEAPQSGRVPRSVREVFRNVLEGVLPLAAAKDVDIGVLEGEDFRIPAWEADLDLLVKNLVDNAVRYTPEQGRVDLSVFSESGRVVIQVEDTGPGIPEAERERVFDPFYRVVGSGEQGSGLGLSIVRAVADRLGAEVALAYADPEGRSGLRVQVRIPASGTN